MAASATKTRFAPFSIDPPIVQPNLLPVHIPWSGPAPVSTYFMVKPVVPSEGQKNGGGTFAKLKRRFVSAFRGRKLQGLEVCLPEGYQGLVLRTADSAKVAGIERKADAVDKQRRQQQKKNEDGMEDDSLDGQEETDSDGHTRYLEAVSRFQSILVWHPDNPVDEIDDVYIQSLAEWINLSKMIHQP